MTGDVAGALDIRNCHLESLSGVGGTISETNIANCVLELDGGA